MSATPFPAQRLKYAATINDEALSESTDADFELAYIDIGNVDSQGRVHDIVNYRFEDAPSRARRVVRDGDVIVSTVRTYLQAIAPVENPSDNLIVSTGFAVVRPSNLLDHRFCKYALRANRFLWEVESRSTGVSYPAINASDLGDIKVSLPEIGAQRIIANYLDRETARIDRLIAEKERMLALLEEKRAALISRIVTRGLDPNAPLKPSGQEWVGKIPAHWEMQPIKYLAVVGNGSTPSVENADYWDDEGYPWLNSSVVNASLVTTASRFVTDTALQECHLPKIQPPAVLVGITGQGKTRGMASVLGVEATINQHLAFIKPRSPKLDTEYLCYLLGHAYNFLRSDSDGAGSTKGAITCEQLANMKIPVPPGNEQIDICSRIKQSLKVSKPLCSHIQRSLDLLIERRSTLITAAVTGEVRPEEMIS
ncbi:MAG: restriction endonuclease subunit S [Burkholderiales bacterium]